MIRNLYCVTCYVRWKNDYTMMPGEVVRYAAAHSIVDAEQTVRMSLQEQSPAPKSVRVDKIERIDLVSIAPYQYERKDSDQ